MRYSPLGRHSISLHDDALADLEELDREDEDAAAAIWVFIEEASASQEILERFICDRYRSYGVGSLPDFSVQRWESLWKKHALWRLKLFDVPRAAQGRRLVYALDPQTNRYHILGVLPRDFDYDPQHALSRRIIAAYIELELPS